MVADFSKAVTSGRNSGRRFDDSEKEPGLFWWTIAIIILTGIMIFTWVFSIYIFSYPEKPFNYRLLTKLNKLEPITRFDRLEVPGGKERNAKSIYTEFYEYDDNLLRVKNDLFLRSYLWNYTEDTNPIYLIGEFKVLQIRTLTADDAFTAGVVVRAKAEDYPNLFVELVFPTRVESVPSEHFRPGDIVKLEKSRSYAAVLHLSRFPDDNFLISAVSLVYGRYRIDDTRFINQSPPDHRTLEQLKKDYAEPPTTTAPKLNMLAPFPITVEEVGADSGSSDEEGDPDFAPETEP